MIDQNVTKSILSNGFRKCGLYPWNPSAVNILEQEQVETGSTETHLLRMEYLKQGLQFLNNNIEIEKLNTLRCSSEQWTGNPQDTSLFLLWKRTQIEIEKYSIPAKEPINHNANPAALYFNNNTQVEDFANMDTNQLTSLPDNTAPIEESLNDDVIPAVPIQEGRNNTIQRLMNGNTNPSLLVNNVNSCIVQASNNVTPQDILFEDNLTTQTAVLPQNTTTSCVTPTTSTSNNVPSPFKNHFFLSTCRK